MRRATTFFSEVALVVMTWTLMGGSMVSAADGKTFVYVSGYSPTIACYILDRAHGTLTPSSTSPGGTSPSFLAWSADHRFMYAINETNPAGKVLSFSVDSSTGALTRINDASSAGSGPCHLAVHPGGHWLATANYTSGHVGILPIKADGSLGEPIDTVLVGKNAHEVVWDRSGAYLFVPCAGSDYIAQYRFDGATGALSPNRPATVSTQAGAGPRHLVFNHTQSFAYGINEQGNSITTYSYAAATGVLTAVNVVSTLPATVNAIAVKNSTAEIHVAPSGEFLYGSNRGHNSIAIYRLDPSTGLPTAIADETGGGAITTPRHFSFSSTGDLSFVANQDADTVMIFTVNVHTGTMSTVSTLPVSKGPSFVAAMPAP